MTQEYYEIGKYIQSCTEIVRVEFRMLAYINTRINLKLL